jgi:hypothetical protein
MKLAVAVYALCVVPGLAASDEGLLMAIGIAESRMDHLAVGDGGRALGAYQMHPEAWEDANAHLKAQGKLTHPRAAWRDSHVQKRMASAYLEVIRTRLRAYGIRNPSPGVLALCWNRGPAGAKSRGFVLTDYAKRVVSIRQSLPCDFRK